MTCFEKTCYENENILLGRVSRSPASARKLKVEGWNQITSNYFGITHAERCFSEMIKLGGMKSVYGCHDKATDPQILLLNSPNFARKTAFQLFHQIFSEY